MSEKVLRHARQQQAQVAEEMRPRNKALEALSAGASESEKHQATMARMMEEDDEYTTAELDKEFGHDDEFVTRTGEFVDMSTGVKMDDADKRALESFMSKDAAPRLTLGEIIYQKIQEKKAMMEAMAVSLEYMNLCDAHFVSFRWPFESQMVQMLSLLSYNS